MNKILCNTIDYVFAENIVLINENNIVLKTGHEWKNLPVKERPVYSSQRLQDDAGPYREQSVTAITKYNEAPELKKRVAFSVVLRMRTDSETFYVGTDRFHCMTEISDDMINDTFTFKVKSVN